MKFFEKHLWRIIIITGILGMIKMSFGFILLSSLIFYACTDALIFLNKVKRSGVKCQGRILSFEEDENDLLVPIIEFKPDEWELVAAKPFVYTSTHLNSLISNSRVGDEVPVVYDPDDPKKIVLSGNEGLHYSIWIIGALLMLLFFLVGVCMLLGYMEDGGIVRLISKS